MWCGVVFSIWALHSLCFCQLPDQALQLILVRTADWDSFRGTASAWERASSAEPWRPALGKPWPVLLGRKGLAWGRGAFVRPQDGTPDKREKDGRAPAGVFELGPVHGYAAVPPEGTVWSYVQVGPFDAWIDDPSLPHYNEHVRVDPKHVPAWFESQKMRLGDNAYRWLLEIRHNTRPAKPGYGSAIFFHVRRGVDRPTAGCTSMAVTDLESLIRWLRPKSEPRYVLLPAVEYQRLHDAWHLP